MLRSLSLDEDRRSNWWPGSWWCRPIIWAAMIQITLIREVYETNCRTLRAGGIRAEEIRDGSQPGPVTSCLPHLHRSMWCWSWGQKTFSYVLCQSESKSEGISSTPLRAKSSWQQADWWWATDSFKKDTIHLRLGPNETTFPSVPCLASLETHRHFSTNVKVQGLEVAQLWRLLHWQRIQVCFPASAWRLIPL